MTAHTGPGHADVGLTISERTSDGGAIFQSWTICECSLPWLRGHLGSPPQESLHTAETLRATGYAVMSVPGIVDFEEGL